MIAPMGGASSDKSLIKTGAKKLRFFCEKKLREGIK